MKMKKTGFSATMLSGAMLALTMAGAAQGMDHGEHGSHGGGHAGMTTPAAQAGGVIRTATVDGFRLSYTLLNWEERNKAMQGMEGMEMAGMDTSGNSTHHLVLSLVAADAKEVSGAKVGYQVTRPDGGEQKTLTMAMGGYGADVNLRAKGVYTIKTKFVVGSKTGYDTFTYEVR